MPATTKDCRFADEQMRERGPDIMDAFEQAHQKVLTQQSQENMEEEDSTARMFDSQAETYSKSLEECERLWMGWKNKDNAVQMDDVVAEIN